MTILRKFIPKRPSEAIRNTLYIELSSNRGLLVYDCEIVPLSKGISLVSIDIKNNTYECIRNVYIFRNVNDVDYEICRRDNLVFIRYPSGRDSRMLIFHIDDSFSIKSCQEVVIPLKIFLLNSINGKLIFSRINKKDPGELTLTNFTILNFDNSFTEIETTGLKITSSELDISSTRRFVSYPFNGVKNSIHGEWHDSKAFVLYNKIYYKYRDFNLYPVVKSSPKILVFELESRTWSEILLNLPLNRSGYLLHIDHSGILNIVVYTKINNFMEFSATSIRIPLEKPEKLLHLCWFLLRTCALSDKFDYLKSLI
jgi:hypothetical protein